MENKQAIIESRELGLPTGITRHDVEKFKEVLQKHGDAKQNLEFTKKIDQIVETAKHNKPKVNYKTQIIPAKPGFLGQTAPAEPI